MKLTNEIVHEGSVYEHLSAKLRISCNGKGELSIIGTFVPAKINDDESTEELTDRQIPLRMSAATKEPAEITLSQEIERALQKYIDSKKI